MGRAPLDELVGTNPKYNKEEERGYYNCKCLGVFKNVLAAILGSCSPLAFYMGPLLLQLSQHCDETYREVKYGLSDIDSKMLKGINMGPLLLCSTHLYSSVAVKSLWFGLSAHIKL